MKSTKELKEIKKVKLKEDNKEYYIYSIYNDKELSLCIYGYDDAEQDFLTNINEVNLK